MLVSPILDIGAWWPIEHHSKASVNGHISVDNDKHGRPYEAGNLVGEPPFAWYAEQVEQTIVALCHLVNQQHRHNPHDGTVVRERASGRQDDVDGRRVALRRWSTL
jgi:hypothetical protein